jgi:hypothetical protein
MCQSDVSDIGDSCFKGSGSDFILLGFCFKGSGSDYILLGLMCLWIWSSGGISQSITPGDVCVMLLHSLSNVLLSERGEQDAESETQSNAEENHNTDMDEERDVDMDADEEPKEEEEMGNEDGAPSQVKDEVLDKVPVVLTANPMFEDKADLKVKDESEEETKPVVEVRVISLCTMLPIIVWF